MDLFINDVHIILGESTPRLLDEERYNFVIDARKSKITKANLINHVLLTYCGEEELDTLLSFLDSTYVKNLLSITLIAKDPKGLKKYLKSKFKVIKAAGGVVKKGKKILLIYRLKKWDLPKGKIEKKEDAKTAAAREVLEECGVEVKVLGKVCSTWHTYTMKKQNILKKTSWYSMKCTDDSKMQPQAEEDIEKIEWFSPKEVFHHMQDSYNSVHYVIDSFYKKINNTI